MNELIKNLLNDAAGVTGKVRWITTDTKTGEVVEGTWSKNLIMFSTGRGRQMLLDRLAGVPSNTGIVNYGGIGTSATAVTTTDTQLGAETVRTLISTATISANVLTLKFFYADATLANGSYYEFGTFVDGTAVANSGSMFNHALFGSVHNKTAGKDTTVQVDITIT